MRFRHFFHPSEAPLMSILFTVWAFLLFHSKRHDLTPLYIISHFNRHWWRTAIWTLSSPPGFMPSRNDRRHFPISPTLLSHEPYNIHNQHLVMLKKSTRASCKCAPDSSVYFHKNTEQFLKAYNDFILLSMKYLEQIMSSFVSVWGKILLKCLLVMDLKLLPVFHLKSILCLNQYGSSRSCHHTFAAQLWRKQTWFLTSPESVCLFAGAHCSDLRLYLEMSPHPLLTATGTDKA